MKRTLVTALIAIPVLLALSYPWRNAEHGAGAIVSAAGWFGFLLALLVVIVVAVALGVRRLRTHKTAVSARHATTPH